MFPAFKEWHAVVAALTAGDQQIILRKGGIAEGRGGFKAGCDRFWLLPTHFHAQAEKLKPSAAAYLSNGLSPEQAAPNTVFLSAFADLLSHRFVTDWDEVVALDTQHCWTESTVRERFNWSKPPGIHLLTVRVHRLLSPVSFELTSDQAGCKSWVELPMRFDDHPSMPVQAHPTTARS